MIFDFVFHRLFDKSLFLKSYHEKFACFKLFSIWKIIEIIWFEFRIDKSSRINPYFFFLFFLFEWFFFTFLAIKFWKNILLFSLPKVLIVVFLKSNLGSTNILTLWDSGEIGNNFQRPLILKIVLKFCYLPKYFLFIFRSKNSSTIFLEGGSIFDLVLEYGMQKSEMWFPGTILILEIKK